MLVNCTAATRTTRNVLTTLVVRELNDQNSPKLGGLPPGGLSIGGRPPIGPPIPPIGGIPGPIGGIPGIPGNKIPEFTLLMITLITFSILDAQN